jgi:hypothetical protein
MSAGRNGVPRLIHLVSSPSILVLAVLVTIGCLACAGQASEPPRPASVPPDAIWVGGPDGGVFLVLEKRAGDPPATYRGRVFADASGELLFQGPLIMVPENHAPIDIRKPETFSGWDGESLHLADGARLRASAAPRR